jgi:short-subunit dehydrogenase
MIRVNLLGVVYAFEAVLPEMLERGRGQLAAVSSLAAYVALPGEAGYCASKAAVNTYLKALRLQLRPRGIAVTTICPGFIKTAMTDQLDAPKPWLMNADEGARRIVRALERRKAVFNFPWQTTLLIRLTSWLPERIIRWAMKDVTGKPPLPTA